MSTIQEYIDENSRLMRSISNKENYAWRKRFAKVPVVSKEELRAKKRAYEREYYKTHTEKMREKAKRFYWKKKQK